MQNLASWAIVARRGSVLLDRAVPNELAATLANLSGTPTYVQKHENLAGGQPRSPPKGRARLQPAGGRRTLRFEPRRPAARPSKNRLFSMAHVRARCSTPL